MKLHAFLALTSLLFLFLVQCTETLPTLSSRHDLTLSSVLPLETHTSLGSGKKSCGLSKTKRGLRIAGATLLGVGAASLITGGVLLSLHEKLTYGVCGYGALPTDCVWNTRTGGGVAMGLGGAGMLAGGMMLGYSFAPGKTDDSCKNAQ